MQLIISLILGGILYVTNPTTDDFNLYLKQQVESRVADDNPFSKLLIGGFVMGMIKDGVYRKDYVLFSKYTVDTSLIAAFKEGMPPRIDFFGVFGIFIPTTDISQLK
jgi:hypothetical protein